MATNLDEALLEFQADPPVLTKNKAGHQSKYADLVQVNEKLLSKLNGLGVIFTSAPTRLDDGQFVLEYELKHVASQTAKGGRYPLKLSDNPQQMGSAITYARRYVLQSLTSVAAEDEDDDGQAASGRRTAQRATQPRQQPRPDAEPAQPRAQRAAPAAPPPLPGETAGITEPQKRRIFALLGDRGITDRDKRLAGISKVIGRQIDSTNDLTRDEAARVIDVLEPAEAKADVQ